MNIKHSKYRNTGILFELLVRQITADTLKEGESPAVDLLKNYFFKSELGKELKLYESITKSKVLSENQASAFISTVLEQSTKLNRSVLRKEKYNLIKEIKSLYNINEFFATKVKNYTQFASIYTLIESQNSNQITNTEQIVDNKVNLLEHLTKTVASNEVKNDVLSEFQSYDKDTRILTYKVLLEKFNDKYDDLSNDQKSVLKEFIESVDSTPKLRNFYNSKIKELKYAVLTEAKTLKDKVVKIKLVEVSKLLTELKKTDKVNTDNLVDLLQYYELIKEIKLTK
tara:strand:+ start:157 stop:1008 length:852 start_codon:yes stop_codon:yes gene_type:complete